MIANNILNKGESLNLYADVRQWDITTDGEIACCRINYDDYVNFEIEVLTQEQIEEYKGKEQMNADD